MKVAICDDSIEDLMTIESVLLKYCERNPKVSFEVEN